MSQAFVQELLDQNTQLSTRCAQLRGELQVMMTKNQELVAKLAEAEDK